MILWLRMARQIASGLALLHDNHILHRDIKSMNILVTDQFDCKLTDFGMSKLVGDQEIFNTANAGTPLWMAPEVRAGMYNFPADIYSLGLVLFELFEHRLPDWDRANSCVVLPQNYISLPIVTRCLQTLPEHRPTAHQVVALIDEAMTVPTLTSLRRSYPTLYTQAAAKNVEEELSEWVTLLRLTETAIQYAEFDLCFTVVPLSTPSPPPDIADMCVVPVAVIKVQTDPLSLNSSLKIPMSISVNATAGQKAGSNGTGSQKKDI